MAMPAERRATYEDLLAVPDHLVAELIGGSLVTHPRPAAKHAVAMAAKSLRDLRIGEITKLDMKIEGGKVVAYRARVQLSFKYEG